MNQQMHIATKKPSWSWFVINSGMGKNKEAAMYIVPYFSIHPPPTEREKNRGFENREDNL